MKAYFLFIVLFLTFSSCKKALKNVEDYFPEITMTAEIQDDGTVLVKGQFVKNGEGALENFGFSFSKDPDWYISENQILLSPTGDFSFVYDQPFDPNSTYYFRAFAINYYGYSMSNIVELSDIKAVPVIAPCTVTPNSFKINTTTNYISNFQPASYGFDYVEYQSSGSSVFATFKFNSPPLTGIYTTKQYLSEGEKDVVVTLSNGFDNGHLSYEKSVYVNRIDSTSFKVEICDATWKIGSATFDVKCNFTRSY
jgi:hypothetical protein|tara:strand:- start:18000 stop:18758 length:759 start_codon:yes stop_codon:yes gene_type:complete